jgi:hypothetical protein
MARAAMQLRRLGVMLDGERDWVAPRLLASALAVLETKAT